MRQLTSVDAQFLAMETPRTYGHVCGLAVYDPTTAPGRRAHRARTSAGWWASGCTCCRRSAGGSRRCRSASTTRTGSRIPTSTSTSTSARARCRRPATRAAARRARWRGSSRAGRSTARTRCGSSTCVHGLDDGRVGVLTKVHHAAVDGMSGDEILSVLLDPSPDGREVAAGAEHGRDGRARRPRSRCSRAASPACRASRCERWRACRGRSPHLADRARASAPCRASHRLAAGDRGARRLPGRPSTAACSTPSPSARRTPASTRGSRRTAASPSGRCRSTGQGDQGRARDHRQRRRDRRSAPTRAADVAARAR